MKASGHMPAHPLARYMGQAGAMMSAARQTAMPAASGAVRASGDAIDDIIAGQSVSSSAPTSLESEFGSAADGGGDGSSSDGTDSSTPSWQQQQDARTQQQAFSIAGQALGYTASTINSIISNGTQQQKNQLQADTDREIAALNAQIQQSHDAVQIAALNSQLSALRTTNAALTTPHLSTPVLVGGGLALAAVIYFVARR